MGAPLLNWIFRGVVVAVAVASVAAIAALPLGIGWRLALAAAALGVACLAAFRFLPAFDPLGRVRWRLPRSGNAVRRCAITFDDGPGPATDAVLDILSAEGVKATFFVLGENVLRHPGAVRRAYAEGHAIGFHGWSHARLHGARVEDVETQLERLRDSLEALGVRAAPLLRTPHGFKSAAVFRAASRRGLEVWAWSRGVWDTARPAPGRLVRRSTRFARSGMVLLLHDGRGGEPVPDVSAMTAALPAIIRGLRDRGFRFVRLTDVT